MAASERQSLAREAERLGCRLDEASIDRLSAYAEALTVWNAKVRMLGDRDRRSLWLKHIPDCLVLGRFLPPAGVVADVGTGAGLPGLVLACIRPDLDLWLIESRAKRVSFLLEAKATLALERVTVLGSRAEALVEDGRLVGRASAVTGRAVALDQIVQFGSSLLSPGGRILAMASLKSAESAGKSAAGVGFRVVDNHRYSLAGGEPREIVVLARA